MKRSRLAFSLVLLSVASAALATTYVRVEKDGSKTYSDRPIPGGVPVEVQPAQGYSAPSPPVNTRLPAEQRLLQQMDDFKYSSCSVRPANDETFTNPESVAVSASTEPMPRSQDTMTLSVDGVVVATNNPSYLMNPADRGTHTVTLTMKDRFGRVLCSATSSFHVLKPSINMPRRR
jgi:Domain of unknown function (DUF4124)